MISILNHSWCEIWDIVSCELCTALAISDLELKRSFLSTRSHSRIKPKALTLFVKIGKSELHKNSWINLLCFLVFLFFASLFLCDIRVFLLFFLWWHRALLDRCRLRHIADQVNTISALRSAHFSTTPSYEIEMASFAADKNQSNSTTKKNIKSRKFFTLLNSNFMFVGFRPTFFPHEWVCTLAHSQQLSYNIDKERKKAFEDSFIHSYKSLFPPIERNENGKKNINERE